MSEISINREESIERELKISEENQKIVDTHIMFDDCSLEEFYADDTEVIEEHLANYQWCADYHRYVAEQLQKLEKIEKLYEPKPFGEGLSREDRDKEIEQIVKE